MKNKLYLLSLILLLFACKDPDIRKISILQTTDIHGAVLDYDFIEKKSMSASLASAATYIKKVRENNNPVVLLDNGDNLQGQPVVYYYNFIDTLSPHLNAEVMNYLKYDAATVGNHDIEAGHKVYDRLVKEYDFPLLAANAVEIKTGDPYFRPYTIIERNNLRIAVMGLTTPAVTSWLPYELYSGIEFRDMEKTAKKWMPVIKAEKPDLIVGLFHSGWDNAETRKRNGYNPDNSGSVAVAFNVPGFDIIFTGHDHKTANETILNSEGDPVLILNGGSRGENIARADVIFIGEGRKPVKKITGEIVDVNQYKPDRKYTDNFRKQKDIVKEYVDKVIAVSKKDISSRDAFFGPSAFVEMIHSVQLAVSGADISFAAPLSFDVKISKGPVTVGDMFKLYRFENMLYTVSMTGEEIRKYLEFSYSQWLNTMTGPSDRLIKFRKDDNNNPVLINGRAWLSNQAYNFDSAAGIDYIVDISKPEGSRIKITSLSGGRHFNPRTRYLVAVNSYRGNGGGGHFAKGAGIGSAQLNSRVISSTDKDLRYYILKDLEKKKEIDPLPRNNWKIVPDAWVKKAAPADYKLLFGETM
ncbi:MAG: bifunctional metallophosphatase/5'-nucleotidase [Bacteroidales bacterium]